MKFKLFSRQKLLLALILLLLFITSCKKDISKSSGLQALGESTTSTNSNQSDIITQKEVFDWLISQGSELTKKISWDNIEQATIKKQYVVKIPLSDTSALFLLKKNKTINAYAYKWQTQKTTDSLYTGSMVAFNIQTGFLYQMTYIEGMITHKAVYESTQNKNEKNVKVNDFSHQPSNLIVKGNSLYLSDLLCMTLGYAFDPSYNCGIGAFLAVFEGNGTYNTEPLSVPQGYNWSYNATYYQQTNGNTQPITEDMVGTLGGGVFWVRPPNTPDDDNNGCQVVNDGIRQKTVNNTKEAQIVKIQNTGGCPQWTPYYFDFTAAAPDPTSEVSLDDDSSSEDDINNFVAGGYDNSSYSSYQPNDSWPTIKNVILKIEFVPIVNLTDNCFTLAKKQLATHNYQVSDYYAPNQTIQVYTESGGADINKAKDAVGYLKSALSRGIPVLVGVDNSPGAPSANHDGSTNHFIVIVGMGNDVNGKFFRFYDSSTNWPSLGTSDDNKLYYDSSTGIISGKTQSQYGRPRANHHDYIVTQVRKSKSL